jgi:hypothetical protein
VSQPTFLLDSYEICGKYWFPENSSPESSSPDNSSPETNNQDLFLYNSRRNKIPLKRDERIIENCLQLVKFRNQERRSKRELKYKEEKQQRQQKSLERHINEMKQTLDGWMDFGGWSLSRLLHAGLNSGLMCSPGREVRRKDFGWEYE